MIHPMKALAPGLSALMTLGISTSSFAQASPDSCISPPISNNLAYLVAPIKSESDLQKHLFNLKDGSSPLNHLSPSGLEKFKESLTFNESGLTSYRYDVLEWELSVSQAYHVLALFGQQHNIALLENLQIDSKFDLEIMEYIKASNKCNDYKGYACVSHATCQTAGGKICMHNC